MSETTEGNTFAFKSQTQKVLKIITHSLYQHEEVFLREMISNASDALNKVRLKLLTSEAVVDEDLDLEIEIFPDEEKNTLTIRDRGIGMTKQELVDNLGTIAQSGTEEFFEAIEKGDDSLIGMFGVGFYSAFLVAEKVEVITRGHSPNAKAWRWVSIGEESFTIEEGQKDKRGTDIILHLKEDKDEFLKPMRIKQLVKQYSNYIQFPIKLDDEIINEQTALWRVNPDEVEEEEYDEFYNYLGKAGEPMATIHINVDVPFQFYAILFIPQTRPQNWGNEPEWGLTLYSRKVLINENNKDLIPEYLRFVVGVVDAEDLQLNVSREVLQNNRAQRTISKYVQKKIIGKIEDLAEDDEDDYMMFFREFGPYLKEGIAANDKNKDRLVELLRFHSTHEEGKDGSVSLEDYVTRMKPDQDKIYYLTGLELDMLKNSPHLEYYKENDLEVLLMGEAIDSFLMMHLHEYHEKSFFLIDQDEESDEETETTPEMEDDEETDEEKPKKKTGPYAPLLNRMIDVLGNSIADVKTSKRLVGSVARLVTQKGGIDSNLQRAMRIMEAQNQGAGMNMPMMGKVLQVNPEHKLINKLNDLIENDPEDQRIDILIKQIHDNARISDGDVPDFSDMLKRLESIMELAVK